MRLTLIDYLTLLGLATVLLALGLPKTNRDGLPQNAVGWALLVASLGMLLFTVASIAARVLLAVLRWLFGDRS